MHKFTSKTYLVLLLILGLFAQKASSAWDSDADWHPDPNNICGGYYKEHQCLHTSEELDIKSDGLQITQDDIYKFSGNVRAQSRNKELYTGELIVNRHNNVLRQLEAKQYVRLYEPGTRITASRALVNNLQELTTIWHAQYRYYPKHARGGADTVVVCGKNNLHLQNATYTTCKPREDDWILKAKTVNLDKKIGRGTATHATLYLKKIPIFYSPYFDFPIDNKRHNGFLYPKIANSNRSGLFVATPYYFNLAPDYDATTTPFTFSKRGAGLQQEVRYLTQHSHGEWQGMWLNHDKAHAKHKSAALAAHPGLGNNDRRVQVLARNHNTRYATSLQHYSRLSPSLNLQLEYKAASDSEIPDDFQTYLTPNMNTTQLPQRLRLNHQNNFTDNSILVEQHQVLHPFQTTTTTPPYRKLPQINSLTFYPLENGVELGTALEYSHFSHKISQHNQRPYLSHAQRYHLRPQLSYTFFAASYSIKPRLQWDFLRYHHPINGVAKTRTLPILDTHAKMYLYRNTAKGLTHSVEPQLYWLYVPYQPQDELPLLDSGYSGFNSNHLYRDNRFTGIDRLGDTHQLSFGINTRLRNNDFRELVSAYVGQIKYFKKRKVTTAHLSNRSTYLQDKLAHYSSDIVGGMKISPYDKLFTALRAQWDPYGKKVERFNATIHNQQNPWEYSLGYHYFRNMTIFGQNCINHTQRSKQFHANVLAPLFTNWRAIAGLHYDLEKNYAHKSLLGFEHDSCCVASRVIFSRVALPFDIQRNTTKVYDHKIMFTLYLKGLSSVGTKSADAVISELIPNYEWLKNKQ